MPHRQVVLPDQRKHDSQDHHPHAADAARVGIDMPFLGLRAAGAARSTNTLAAGAGRAARERGDAAHPFCCCVLSALCVPARGRVEGVQQARIQSVCMTAL